MLTGKLLLLFWGRQIPNQKSREGHLQFREFDLVLLFRLHKVKDTLKAGVDEMLSNFRAHMLQNSELDFSCFDKFEIGPICLVCLKKSPC